MIHRTKIHLAVAIVTLLLVGPSSVFAFRNGPPPERNGSTDSDGFSCQVCHGTTTGPGSVQIIGAPTTYQLGEFYNLTVRVQDDTKLGAGFQISAEDAGGAHAGFLIVADLTNTKLNFEYVDHTAAGVGNAVSNWASLGNAAEFDVLWEAPATDMGPITFWAAGNAINNNFSNSGDIVYLTSTTATLAAEVPTVSQWGMLAMLILIMTAATLVINRNQSAVVLPAKK